jgi:hypothetical protein
MSDPSSTTHYYARDVLCRLGSVKLHGTFDCVGPIPGGALVLSVTGRPQVAGQTAPVVHLVVQHHVQEARVPCVAGERVPACVRAVERLTRMYVAVAGEEVMHTDDLGDAVLFLRHHLGAERPAGPDLESNARQVLDEEVETLVARQDLVIFVPPHEVPSCSADLVAWSVCTPGTPTVPREAVPSLLRRVRARLAARGFPDVDVEDFGDTIRFYATTTTAVATAC